jgi:ferredoxin--NADP+ reductase
MAELHAETVLRVHHWNETLFSFATSRDPAFRFRNGQFTMVGIEADGRPLLRAYSMASANYEEELEFFSIKVPNGPLTSRLKDIKPGDQVYIGRKPTGTLVLDALRPGSRLFLLGTGTGLAPFLSIIKDPETYDQFSQVILMHGCRNIADLAYQETIQSILPGNEWVGPQVRAQLIYVPTVTREPFSTNGRITELLESGAFLEQRGMPKLDVATDRVMLCGSPQFLADMQDFLTGREFEDGGISNPGHFVIEKAFVEK